MNTFIKIGCIEYNFKNLEDDLSKLSHLPCPNTPYSEFTNGHWYDYPLFTKKSDMNNLLTLDNPSIKASPTPICAKLPYLTDIICKNFKRSFLQMAKIRNLKQALILPHIDFLEFPKLEKGKFIRILMALNNCYDAYHYGTNGKIQLIKGEVWLVNAHLPHSAINKGQKNRYILSLDFYLQDFYDISLSNKLLQVLNKDHNIQLCKLMSTVDSNIDDFDTQGFQKSFIWTPLTYDYVIQKYSNEINKKNIKQVCFFLFATYLYEYEIYDLRQIFTLLHLLINNFNYKSKQNFLNLHLKHLFRFLLVSRFLGERYNWQPLEDNHIYIKNLKNDIKK